MQLLIEEGSCYRHLDFCEARLTGTPEELLALAHALTMKAKHPDNYHVTYTGIDCLDLRIECKES